MAVFNLFQLRPFGSTVRGACTRTHTHTRKALLSILLTQIPKRLSKVQEDTHSNFWQVTVCVQLKANPSEIHCSFARRIDAR